MHRFLKRLGIAGLAGQQQRRLITSGIVRHIRPAGDVDALPAREAFDDRAGNARGGVQTATGLDGMVPGKTGQIEAAAEHRPVRPWRKPDPGFYGRRIHLNAAFSQVVAHALVDSLTLQALDVGAQCDREDRRGPDAVADAVAGRIDEANFVEQSVGRRRIVRPIGQTVGQQRMIGCNVAVHERGAAIGELVDESLPVGAEGERLAHARILEPGVGLAAGPVDTEDDLLDNARGGQVLDQRSSGDRLINGR